MIDLPELREYMKKLAKEDKARKIVRVSGDTLQVALKQASVELSVPIRSLEYEVVQSGGGGFMGFGAKEFTIIAYEGKQTTAENEFFSDGSAYNFSSADFGEQVVKDGEIAIRFQPDGVFLKVTAPVDKGKRITERMVQEAFSSRPHAEIDYSMVANVVKQADGEFVRVGEFEYNPAHDSLLTVIVSDDEMKAFVTLTPPEPGGADVSGEAIKAALVRNGVVAGMLQDAVDGLENSPRYREAVPVAEGEKAVNGKDARIVYSFETDHSQVKLKEKDGRVDFKDLNLVQNVVEGQVLARKMDPEQGTPGKTVTGKIIPAKDGRDVQIGIGKNVRLSDDGRSVIAMINGQVLLVNGKINVEPVYVVPGDVNLRTGHILFLGTVMVKGSVTDGFSVKAAGNIEVMGNVGKCELDAEGDIIVHQGITGKGGGVVRCGHSLWAKFIENAHVEAGEFVVVSDGIINSSVDANKKILCKGKRASIVGGKLRAAEGVSAKTLGSVAGSETILEVGYDPKSKEKYIELERRRNEIEKQHEDVKLNLITLENLKKVRKQLPEDKEAFYIELRQKQVDILTEMKKVMKEMENIQNYLSSLKIMGKISVAGKVYSGVKIFIKDAPLEVRNEFRAVTFILENEIVKVTRYEEEDEEVTRRA